MMYGWSVEYCLEMNSKTFFSIVKAGSDLYNERMSMIYLELCDIVVCSTGNAEYHKDLKQIYFDRLKQSIEIKSPNTFDLSDKNQGLAAFMKIAKSMGVR
jgi:hypothetical protein